MHESSLMRLVAGADPENTIHTDGSTSERNSTNMLWAPFDLPAARIFKVGADGRVHEIEAMGFSAPYDSPTGWGSGERYAGAS